jgi:hypothetical protein
MEQELIAGGVGLAVSFALLFWRSIKKATTDRLALEQQLTQAKDQATAATTAFQTQLTTVQSQLQTSDIDRAKLSAEIAALTQQCQRLRDELQTQATQVQTDAIEGSFAQIQTLLTQYPSVRRMVATQPELPARNIIALLTSLENLVNFWDCQAIGQPWEMVKYNPQLHQGDVHDIQVDEAVYIRFVGYQKSDRILIPAKVSRTLPTGAKA